MRSYEERCDCAFKLAKAMLHNKAIELIIKTRLASDVGEADQLIRDGERRAIQGIKATWPNPLRAPLKRAPRYDPVMQEAEDDLAKRHGRRDAQEMMDEEERCNSGKGR